MVAVRRCACLGCLPIRPHCAAQAIRYVTPVVPSTQLFGPFQFHKDSSVSSERSDVPEYFSGRGADGGMTIADVLKVLIGPIMKICARAYCVLCRRRIRQSTCLHLLSTSAQDTSVHVLTDTTAGRPLWLRFRTICLEKWRFEEDGWVGAVASAFFCPIGPTAWLRHCVNAARSNDVMLSLLMQTHQPYLRAVTDRSKLPASFVLIPQLSGNNGLTTA